jgi:hypothetical protein
MSVWTYKSTRWVRVEARADTRYGQRMPNRKTFDPRDKYDHSSRPLGHAQKNDLQADVIDEGSRSERGSSSGHGDPPPRRADSRRGKPSAGR